MVGYRLSIAVKPNKNITFQKLHTTVVKGLVNYVLSQDEYLLQLHKRNRLKGYSFKLLEPIEMQKTYSKNKIYAFEIRFAVKKTAEMFYNVLQNIDSTPAFKIIGSKVSAISFDWFSQAVLLKNTIYSVTPATVTVNSHTKPTLMWSKEKSDMQFLIKSLENNLSAKSRNLFNIENENKFIKDIEVISERPIVVSYADKTKIFGNKFKITINPDKQSYMKAFCAYICGIGEKNGIGFGTVEVAL